MSEVRRLGSSLGVMQGRLSPMIFGGYQAFPTDSWQEEFQLARDRGLQHVEWVLDFPSLAYNPMLTNPDIIKRRCDETNIRVVSVCADFLMDLPLNNEDPSTWKSFDQLLVSVTKLDVRYIVIPCVDQSSLADLASKKQLIRAMQNLSGQLTGGKIQVALETDLPPKPFCELLDELDPAYFGVNYDIGNSASLGFDPEQELESYGSRVNLLHVKDRHLHGGSVLLGTGSANLQGVLAALCALQFDGPVTLQCFRDQEGVTVFDEQLSFYRSLIQEILHGS